MAQFVFLIEALQRRDVEQHVLVADSGIARRLALLENVSVGPVVHSAISAYCLLPRVDLVHVHDTTSAQAGLLLALTRSIPYVLTHRGSLPSGKSPLLQSIYKRAVRVICPDSSDEAVLRHFEPDLRISVMPESIETRTATAYLRLYQNSQSTPTAGSNGIQ